mgnify:CR=1 FL=1
MRGQTDQHEVNGGLAGLEALVGRAGTGGGAAPVERWNPPHCGKLDIRIGRDGLWYYLGTPVAREPLVQFLVVGALVVVADLVGVPLRRTRAQVRIVVILAVVVAKNRLTAIVSLGIQGFGVALIFMLLGAPDLSFTQFMVEVLSVIILTLVMTRLNLSPSDHRSWGTRLRDGTIAIACGAGFALALIAVVEHPFDPRLSEFFADYARALWAEIMPTVTAPEGVSLTAYAEALFDRYANPAIRHRTWQIAMDGSQKLPHRILGTLHANLA